MRGQFFFASFKLFLVLYYPAVKKLRESSHELTYHPFCYFYCMIKNYKISKILSARILSFSLLLSLVIGFPGCSDNQNTFVPYAKVDKYISLVNYNNLVIPGNSMTFPAEGYAGLIVICITDVQYLAYDACCPYEGTRLSMWRPIPDKPES